MNAPRNSHGRTHGSGAANYAALNVRVDGLAEDVAQINTRLGRTATSDDVRELSREVKALATPKAPTYTAWIAGAGLALTMFAGFYVTAVTPVNNNIARLEQEKRDDKREITRILEKLSDAIVPRGEHEQRWRAYDERLSALSVRLNEINKMLAEIYSPKDALLDLRQRLEALQRIVTEKMDRPKP